MATNKTVTAAEQPLSGTHADEIGDDAALGVYEHEGRTVQLTASDAKRLGATKREQKSVSQPLNKAAAPSSKSAV